MTFSLRFQDPASDAANLLELLLESVNTAERGAGVFSFSSAHGIRLLLSDDDFAAFLERSTFELIVGIDAVTVPEALNLLHTAQAAYGGFRARAFLNPRPASL
ncbi:MAG: hypothetical protein F4X11_08525 [Acidobacteria bacterium]|nr:hypothetical protein [Acidobacteriota bacterium]